MKICHVSDIHGGIEKIPKASFIDAYVLSGDIAPNKCYPNSATDCRNEYLYQQEWYQKVASSLQGTFKDKTVICLDGNHDFFPVVEGLKSAGINAVEVTPNGVVVNDVRFAGFPNIPWIGGYWNHESREAQMMELITTTLKVGVPDVLVTHSPPRGILDMTYYREEVGSRPIATALRNTPHGIQAHLFGHIHESAGTRNIEVGDHFVRFSNAATTNTVFEVLPRR